MSLPRPSDASLRCGVPRALRFTSLWRGLLACVLGVSWVGAVLAADATKLRVGVEGSYPPFSMVDSAGKLQGFDIDIARALCAYLKTECTLVQQDFDGLIPSLQARKFDYAIASISITPERAKVVDFTDRYYRSGNRLIAKTGTPIDGSPASLKGKKVGVQRSTIHDRYATATFTNADVVRYTTIDQAFLDLVSGRLDVVFCDTVPGEYGFLKTPAGKGYAFVGTPYVDPAFFGAGVGIAVRKGNDSLRERLNLAIKGIRANGVYKQIQDKYFSFDIYGE